MQIRGKKERCLPKGQELNSQSQRLLLYAPNVHTGGGFVLLKSVLHAWSNEVPLVAWLDARARAYLELPTNAQVVWVRPAIGSRLSAEFSLARRTETEDRILCFHGLPPLLRSKGKVLIFQQNRLYLRLLSLKTFTWRTRQRLCFEQAVAYLFRQRCSAYWVQTPSMARDLKKWYGETPINIHVLPFVHPTTLKPSSEHAQWDFLYVADGEAHKNHRHLIEAWVTLALQGFKPSLALTLSDRDEPLVVWINQKIAEHGLNITNLGHMPHEKLLTVYRQSNALIFPSLTESFGLPLIEARQAGMPILASELDFVRDVCEPTQSFDPNSAMSIARAVRRYLGQDDLPVQTVGAATFLGSVLDSRN